ncbi:DoxX family protein [Aurantimicrobium minutum]|jgi:uncharacterized membrane protein|uniref:Uncharacterized protein n=1 Tax=Aurantimicrobium minutum TaxID=708131 RepID=A0A173LWY8_9MICO|nr:DoxX family protein [Aurantimicrobium minutum]MDH6239711.1 putative membrane protein [Aurantimicrobium minutum]BAU99410.1 Uncharacterized protein AUMI_18680 [Aurantimicrobium minutum]
MTKRGVGSWIVIALLGLSGFLHLVTPQGFLWLMPPELGEGVNLGVVYVSGVVELVCVVGLLLRARWAPTVTVLTLLAIWPANIWFAFSTIGAGNTLLTVIAFVRLPLQLLLLWWAWKSPVNARQG